MIEVKELIKRGKALIDNGYTNISLRKRGLIVFENPEGHQKSVSVKKLQEEQIKKLLETFRSYRDQKKAQKIEIAPEIRVEEEKAYEVAEEIWNDPEYLSEFLIYGTEHVLNFYFGDIRFDHEVAREELERLLFDTGEEMIRKGREERNLLYILSGGLLKENSPNFKGFKNLRNEDKYGEILREKYRKALGPYTRRSDGYDVLEENVWEGAVFDYLGIPREFWRKDTAEGYDAFIRGLKQYYNLDLKREN